VTIQIFLGPPGWTAGATTRKVGPLLFAILLRRLPFCLFGWFRFFRQTQLHGLVAFSFAINDLVVLTILLLRAFFPFSPISSSRSHAALSRFLSPPSFGGTVRGGLEGVSSFLRYSLAPSLCFLTPNPSFAFPGPVANWFVST